MEWIMLYLGVGWLIVELCEWAVRTGRVEAMDRNVYYLWILLLWPVVLAGCAVGMSRGRRDGTDG